MTDFAKWQDDNARYLANAVTRLRALLERGAGEMQESFLAPPPPPPPEEKPKPRWRLFRRREAVIAEIARNADARRTSSVTSASSDLLAAEPCMTPPPALLILGQRFGLSHFEQEVLLLCAAMELDTRIGPLCARAQGDPARPYATFALALGLFSDPSWDALSPERPLRYWRLIALNQPGAQPLTTSPMRIDERIMNYLKGLNYLDDRLAPLLAPVEIPEQQIELPASQQLTVDSIVHYLKQTASHQGPPVIQLLGADASSNRFIAGRAAGALGLQAHRLPAALLPTQAGEIENLARIWQRESLLLPIALFIDAG